MSENFDINQIVDKAYQLELERVLLLREKNILSSKINMEDKLKNTGESLNLELDLLNTEKKLALATKESDNFKNILQSRYKDNYNMIMNLVESRVNIYLSGNDYIALNSSIDSVLEYVKSAEGIKDYLKKEGLEIDKDAVLNQIKDVNKLKEDILNSGHRDIDNFMALKEKREEEIASIEQELKNLLKDISKPKN